MRRSTAIGPLAAIVFAVFAVSVALSPGALAQPPDKLIYRTPQGVEFEIAAEGLVAIRSGGRPLARGGWSMLNGERWFQKQPGPVAAGKSLEERFERLDDRRARVVHVQQDVTCTFDYAFDGEDLTISTRVENRHAEAAMAVTGFAGLEFTFAKRPEGWMREQHISYFQAHGIGLCHPSHYSPIGGSYAQDGSVGAGISPWRTGLSRTLILWDYTDWNPGRRETLPSRRLLYFVADPVPARGARTFDLRLRVSPNVDWRHLLAPYREYFQATFGSVRYRADHRWIATDYLNHSQRAVSPENPYGFHGGHRRIDTAEGAAKFCDTVIPALRDGRGQGIIVWGQGGDDSRGGMYRPDFDVLPPEVEAQWPTLAKRFRATGLKLGVCTRPRHMAVKLDWKRDQIIDINPDDPVHRQMLLRRFTNMIERGVTLFYLDSFGSSFEDVKLMRWLREQLGPEVLTFCEHQCDAILPYSGGYSETTLHAEATPPSYRLWSGARNWEIYQWLVPGAQMASRLYQIQGEPPADVESPDRWFFRHRITPLVPANDFRRAPQMPKLQKEFLTDPVSGVRSDRIHAVRSDRIHAVMRGAPLQCPDESGHYKRIEPVPAPQRARKE